MISKYIYGGFGVALIAAGILIWYLNGQINIKQSEIKLLRANLVACNLSNENLSKSIDSQNEKIQEFNDILTEKNTQLETINKKNKSLRLDLNKKINEINKVQHSTCDETMNWMLQEAINESFSDSTTE